MKKYFKYIFPTLGALLISGYIFSAPVGTVLRSIIPEENNRYFLGTTSPKTYYANTYTQILTVTSGTATTTINAGDTLATFAYPWTVVGANGSATTSNIFIRGDRGIFASSTSMLASTTILSQLNIGTLTATSGTSYLQALTLGTKLANVELANSSVTLNTTSPLGGGGLVSLGGTLTFTCSTCAIGTINSGTANRIAVYSGATTLDSSNLIGALGSGSTTIPSNLTVSSIYASSTVRITGALTLDTALTVANGGTGATTFTSNGVLYGNGTGAISVTVQGSNNTVLTANAGAPSFSASPTLTNLTTTGSSTVFTNLTVAAIYASSTLRVTGATTLDSTLAVTGSTTINNTLKVQSSATTSSLAVNGNMAGCIASTTGATSQLIDWNVCPNYRIILQGTTDIILNSTSSNPIDGGHYTLQLIQDSVVRTVNWATPGALRWWRGTTTVAQTVYQCTWIGMVYNSRSSFYSVIASSTPITAASCQ